MATPQVKIKVAAVHAASVYMDKAASCEKVLEFIRRAGSEGIELLVFPEAFVPGYPYFTEAYPPLAQVQALAQYAEESLVCNETEPWIQVFQKACKEAGVTISLGVSERVPGGYLFFSSQVHISRNGDLLGVHRKLSPTFAERYVWGQGDGYTLRAWKDPLAGESYNLSGLAGWENSMNGARQALIEANQHVHAAAWPALSTRKGFETSANAQVEALMKAHALSAGAFVVSAASYVDDSCLKWMEENIGPQESVKKGGGWSAVVHPSCSYLAGPHTGHQEDLIIAELDFQDLRVAKVLLDANGTHKRPEVLGLTINKDKFWTPPGKVNRK